MYELSYSDNLRAVLPLGDVWAIEYDYCKHLLRMLENADMVAHADRYNALKIKQEEDVKVEARVSGESAPAKPYEFEQGVALIPVKGVLTKKPTSMEDGTSSVRGRNLTRQARRDPDAHTLMFNFDSCPGGNVEGIKLWADEIWRAREEGKRTIGVIHDACHSAGYFLASQCDEIYMTSPTDGTGSIGTYTGISDLSGMAEEKKVKVFKIAPDGYDFKGIGLPGTKVTEEHIAHIRQKVTDINDVFVQSVFRGRGISEDTVKSWGGKSFVGKAAVEKGLVDGIHPIEDIFAAVQRAQMMGSKRTELAARADDPSNGSNNNPPATTGNRGKRMDNKMLSAALAAVGLSTLSTAVATAGDSEDAIAQALAKEFNRPVDPRLAMLDDAGVKSVNDLEQVQEDAAFGQEMTEQLRAEGEKLCIAIFGQDEGPKKAVKLKNLPRAILTDVVETYRAQESVRVGRNESGYGVRRTAGAVLDNVYSKTVDTQLEADDLVAATLNARGKNGAS